MKMELRSECFPRGITRLFVTYKHTAEHLQSFCASDGHLPVALKAPTHSQRQGASRESVKMA